MDVCDFLGNFWFFMGSDRFNQCSNMNFDEIITQTDNSDAQVNGFNTIIGYIEDIVISDSFKVRHWHLTLYHIP